MINLIYVIPSGVRSDEGGTNEVEGSLVVWLSGERPKIPRLRKSSLSRRFAALGMTL
jgi:hypothetical protein